MDTATAVLLGQVTGSVLGGFVWVGLLSWLMSKVVDSDLIKEGGAVAVVNGLATWGTDPEPVGVVAYLGTAIGMGGWLLLRRHRALSAGRSWPAILPSGAPVTVGYRLCVSWLGLAVVIGNMVALLQLGRGNGMIPFVGSLVCIVIGFVPFAVRRWVLWLVGSTQHAQNGAARRVVDGRSIATIDEDATRITNYRSRSSPIIDDDVTRIVDHDERIGGRGESYAVPDATPASQRSTAEPAPLSANRRSAVWWGVVIVSLLLLTVIGANGSARRVVVFGLLGAVGGGLGALLAFGAVTVFGQRAEVLSKVLVACGVVVATKVPPVTERALAVAEALVPTEAGKAEALLAGYPEVRKWIEQQQADGATPAQIKDRSTRLSVLGVGRLDDDTLVERSRLLSAMLSQASTAACANHARRGDAMPILEAADPATRERFMRVGMEAISAQLRGRPNRRYTEAQLEAAFEALARVVSQKQLAQIATAFSEPESISDGDLCAAWRTFHAAIPRVGRAPGGLLGLASAGVDPVPTAAPVNAHGTSP